MKYLAVVIISLSIIGCASEDMNTAMDPVIDNFTVSPSDNQASVSTSAPITLTFAKSD